MASTVAPIFHGRATHPVPVGASPALTPEIALELLRRTLPTTVEISRTARGFHLVFWVNRSVQDGPFLEFSADLLSAALPARGPECHALAIQAGRTILWLVEVEGDLLVVGLAALSG